MIDRLQYFHVIVKVDLESVVINQDHVDDYSIRDYIQNSFDEESYIIIEDNDVFSFSELIDDDLQKIVDQYKIEKRLKSVTS